MFTSSTYKHEHELDINFRFLINKIHDFIDPEFLDIGSNVAKQYFGNKQFASIYLLGSDIMIQKKNIDKL